MNQSPTAEYLRTKVMTAGPGQLQLMLYDGAIRFARQGRAAIAEGNLEVSCEKLLRAQQIVLEMSSALRYDVSPQLCQRLASLYSYVHHRLVGANLQRDLSAADEAIELLEYQRQTWVLLMDKLAGERSDLPVSETPDAFEPAGVDVAG